MSEWFRHLLGLPCSQPVTGHEFVKATDPAWYGQPLCIWLAHPQASRCFRPRRCHCDGRRRTWRPLHGRLWNLFRRPRRSPPGAWARPKRTRKDTQ